MAATDEGRLEERVYPKSIRHKRILDIAGDRPDASIETLAEEIPSATPDLVENILDEYGDPATETESKSTVAASATVDSESGTTPDLTETQLETIHAIHKHPEETMRDLGDRLGVSGSTICDRVNSIDGFDWSNRYTFAAAVLDDERSDTNGECKTMATDNSNREVRLDELAERIRRTEQKVDELDVDAESPVVGDPELVRKVMHACLKSDNISEDEELTLLESFL